MGKPLTSGGRPPVSHPDPAGPADRSRRPRGDSTLARGVRVAKPIASVLGVTHEDGVGECLLVTLRVSLLRRRWRVGGVVCRRRDCDFRCRRPKASRTTISTDTKF